MLTKGTQSNKKKKEHVLNQEMNKGAQTLFLYVDSKIKSEKGNILRQSFHFSSELLELY